LSQDSDSVENASGVMNGVLDGVAVEIARYLLDEAVRVGVVERTNKFYHMPNSVKEVNEFVSYQKRLVQLRSIYADVIRQSVFGTVKRIALYVGFGVFLAITVLAILGEDFIRESPRLLLVIWISAIFLPLIFGIIYRKSVRFSVLREKLSEIESITRCNACKIGFALDAPQTEQEILYTTPREKKARHSDGKIEVTSWVEVTVRENTAQTCLACGHVHYGSRISKIENGFQKYKY
jgi:hypothetical protein